MAAAGAVPVAVLRRIVKVSVAGVAPLWHTTAARWLRHRG